MEIEDAEAKFVVVRMLGAVLTGEEVDEIAENMVVVINWTSVTSMCHGFK